MTEVKGDAHIEQVYKDNLKYYKNDLTLKNNKKKTKSVKKSGQSNKKGNGVQQNCVTERNQTSTPVVQEDIEAQSLTADQLASNDGNDNQQDSDVSSIANVGALDQAPNKKRKPIKIKLRPTKKRKKTKKNTYEVVPELTDENDANEETQQNLPQQAEHQHDSGLEGLNELGTREAVNRQSEQQNNGVRRSRRKKRPTKFNGFVYIAFKVKNCVYH